MVIATDSCNALLSIFLIYAIFRLQGKVSYRFVVTLTSQEAMTFKEDIKLKYIRWVNILNINMKYKVMSKMQFLLFQNYLFFHLLWDFIFLLTNLYVPLLNFALLEWREGLMLATVRPAFQVSAELYLGHHLPLLWTGRTFLVHKEE